RAVEPLGQIAGGLLDGDGIRRRRRRGRLGPTPLAVLLAAGALVVVEHARDFVAAAALVVGAGLAYRILLRDRIGLWRRILVRRRRRGRRRRRRDLLDRRRVLLGDGRRRRRVRRRRRGLRRPGVVRRLVGRLVRPLVGGLRGGVAAGVTGLVTGLVAALV